MDGPCLIWNYLKSQLMAKLFSFSQYYSSIQIANFCNLRLNSVYFQNFMKIIVNFLDFSIICAFSIFIFDLDH